MEPPFDVIALGETMLSLVAIDGDLGTAATFHATHGGAETNALIGLATRGRRTAWISRLGEDEAARRIRREIGLAGVDLRWVTTDPDRPTGVMLRDTGGGVSYRRAGSAASALGPADLDGVPIEGAKAVLVTGVTALIGEGPQRAATALLDRAQGLRVVDPNLRAGLWGSHRAIELIVPLIRRCDLLMGGRQELTTLLDADPSIAPRSLAERCRALGPTEVVIKSGAAGAGVLDERGSWFEHAEPPVDEIDPVGAGDAFDAAYLHLRLDGAAPIRALVEGARAGAATAASLGDTGLIGDPTRARERNRGGGSMDGAARAPDRHEPRTTHRKEPTR